MGKPDEVIAHLTYQRGHLAPIPHLTVPQPVAMTPAAIRWLNAWHHWACSATRCSSRMSARKAAMHARVCLKLMRYEL